MPIDAPSKVFGLPTWAVVVTLGAAGVVGYLIFFRNSSGGGGSGSGSTYSNAGLAVMQNPDESATMALQNQLLSQLGLNFQTGFDSISGSIGELGTSVDTGFSGIGTSINGLSGQISGLQTSVGGLQTAINAQGSQLTNYYNQLSKQQQDAYTGILTQISAANTATQTQNANYYQSLLNTLTNYATSLGSAVNTSAAQQRFSFASLWNNQLLTSGKTSGLMYYDPVSTNLIQNLEVKAGTQVIWDPSTGQQYWDMASGRDLFRNVQGAAFPTGAGIHPTGGIQPH